MTLADRIIASHVLSVRSAVILCELTLTEQSPIEYSAAIAAYRLAAGQLARTVNGSTLDKQALKSLNVLLTVRVRVI